MNLDAMIEAVAEQAIWPGLLKSKYGDRHWRRTFKLAEMIMEQAGGHNGIVGYAALCHDIGRVSDLQDANHGFRGASIAMRIAAQSYATMPMPQNQFNGTMVILGKIEDIVSRHCLDHEPDYLEMQIVHDANILDRVRFDGVASINPEMFALPDVSIPLIAAAMELLESEPAPELGTVIQVPNKIIIPKGRM